MEDFAADVWPEFFYFVGEAIVEDEGDEGAGVAGGGAVFGGVIDIGDCGGGGVAYGF